MEVDPATVSLSESALGGLKGGLKGSKFRQQSEENFFFFLKAFHFVCEAT